MAIVSHLKDLVDGVGELTAQHIRLARVELQEDARFIGARVGVIAALAPLIIVGYGFLCAALAMTLARVMATDLSLLLVGLLNLIIGIGGISVAARQLGKRRVMHESVAQLEVTKTLVAHKEAGR